LGAEEAIATDIPAALVNKEGEEADSGKPMMGSLQALKLEFVKPFAAAMTLSTGAWLMTSNAFSFQMHAAFAAPTFANFVIGTAITLPLIAGRAAATYMMRRGVSLSTIHTAFGGVTFAGLGTMALSLGAPVGIIAGMSMGGFGIGSFFTQTYNYAVEQHRPHSRAITTLFNQTILPSVGIMLSSTFLSPTGSMFYALGLFGASLGLTLPAMKDSSLYKYIRQLFNNRGPRAPFAPARKPQD
jgi:hypothetical protein